MKTTAVSQLKATLSKYLERVKAGEEVVITDRGKPIARIVPISPGRSIPGRLLELERAGLARVGTGKIPGGFWKTARPQDASGAARKALVEEREEDR